jgi:2-dehydro-3-deoxygluconokinase
MNFDANERQRVTELRAGRKVVTFGELMLRLSPPGFERLLQSPVLSATFGGGEANVAVSLAQFGLESYYVTRLPPHAIGEAAVRALRIEGVRTDFIVRGGDRVGIYFTETGASQRASTVIYDRAHSAISELPADAIAWDPVMEGAAWFHVTGITPALGEKATAATRAAVAAAKRAGARVSVDLNYRKKLWTESQAQATMRPLMRDVDVVIANEEDLQSVLGVQVEDTDVIAGTLDVKGFHDAAERVTRDFGPSMVAITLRESISASDNGWSAVLWDGTTKTLHQSQRYMVRLVDRIGGGDSFAAGLIYGLVTGRPHDGALRFAVAASALKQTIPGDFNRVSVAEVDALAKGDASGRVQR